LVNILEMIDFEQIVGQKKSIQLLKALIKFDRIGHAYLFAGKEGIGKKITAIAFAKAINCTGLSENHNPCNHCSSCLKIEKGIHPDFRIISPLNSIITIDQIREIKSIIYWRPLESRKKIFLINDAHKMTIEASNSLLKILEEPPEFAVLILITAEPEIILPTIISRCHRISFQPLRVEEQKEILTSMNLHLDNRHLEDILLLSPGSPGKTIELASNLSKMKKKNRYIDWLIRTKPEQMVSNIFSSRDNELTDIIESFLDFVEIMILWFRDILFFKLGLAQEMLCFPSRIDIIKEFAQYYSQEKIILILDDLAEIPERIEKHINPKILLENFIIRLGD